MSGDVPESQIGTLYELYTASHLFETVLDDVLISLQNGEDVCVENQTQRINIQLKWHKTPQNESIQPNKGCGLMKVLNRAIDANDLNIQYRYQVYHPKWIGNIDTDHVLIPIAYLHCLLERVKGSGQHSTKMDMRNYKKKKNEILKTYQSYILSKNDEIDPMCDRIRKVYQAVTDPDSVYAKILGNVELVTATDGDFINTINYREGFKIGMIIYKYAQLSSGGMTAKEFKSALNDAENSLTIDNVNKIANDRQCRLPTILYYINQTTPEDHMTKSDQELSKLIKSYETLAIYELYLHHTSETRIVKWLDSALKLQIQFIAFDEIALTNKATNALSTFTVIRCEGRQRKYTPNQFIHIVNPRFLERIGNLHKIRLSIKNQHKFSESHTLDT